MIRHPYLCALALLLLPLAAAQEPLETILDRGYVAHWLVCGPFVPDAEGGIAAALKRGEATLGVTDYMSPVGGVARVRPQHLLEVQDPAGKAIWQRAGTNSPSLDLSPFFPNAPEGVAYAAFYATAKSPVAAYLDLQTPLGARVWMNGFPLREIAAAPVVAAGVDRFVVKFSAGPNLIVMEVPGATLEVLAAAAGIPTAEFAVRGLLNRPLLQGKSGFEIALSIRPANLLGEIYYIPRLTNAGTFSGAASDVRQDTLLTLFNPSSKPQPAVEIALAGADVLQPVLVKTPPLAPQLEYQARVPVPPGGKPAGQTVRTKVLLSTTDLGGTEHAASFEAKVLITAPAEGGRVYVIAGPHYTPAQPEDQAQETQRRIASFNKQMAIVTHESGYGIDLGPAEQWRAALTASPQFRENLMTATRRGRCAGQAGYSRPDERLVSGETLARNLLLGLTMGQAQLGDDSQACYAWDLPGVAPQTPQLLLDARLPGLISNLEIAGVPELFRQQAPDGSTVIHRRKQPSAGPGTVDELRQMVSLQRRELLDQGITKDILVLSHRTPPPEPFFLGSASELARAYPAMMVQGGGGCAFLEDMTALPRDTADKLPVSARSLNTGEPGSLLTQPDLKRAHALVESRLLAAEKLATFAALLGAEYPDAALNHAWRQLLYWCTPERLGLTTHDHVYADALAGYREAAELVDEVTRKSSAYLAREADTLKAAPADLQGVSALVVFNTCAWQRTAPCVADIALEGATGLSLMDDLGAAVPFAAERIRATDRGQLRGARLRFVASAVPPMGYRTFYLAPRGIPPKASEREDLQIENDALLLMVDARTGSISSLLDKATGAEFAAGLLNHVVLLDEDAANTEGGRELWTTGGKSTPEGLVRIRTEVSDAFQRLTVTTAFAGGRLVREMTLYPGVPHVECVTRTEGVSLENKLLAATFAAPAQNRGPVYGERFGAVAGRISQGSLDYRTKGRDNLSGAAVYPALRWAASTPGDHIQVANEGAVTLRPAMVVHGEDLILEKAARDIQNALIRRGIPAATSRDQAAKAGTAWTDSTELAAPDSDLTHGQVMYIVVVGPEQSGFCKGLLDGQPEARVKDFTGRLNQGAALYLEHTGVPQGFAPAPALIIAGATVDRTVDMARAFAESVRLRGVYNLPRSGYAPEKLAPLPETGFAVMFPGVHGCSLDRDGTLVIGLAHGAAQPGSAGLHPPQDAPQTFEYALFPFAGDWRTARVNERAEGYVEKLTAVQAGLHAGRQPGVQSLVSFSKPNLTIAAIKPLSNPMAAMTSLPSAPRNGVIMRVFESTGTAWEGDVRLFAPLSELRTATLLENPGPTVPLNDGAGHVQVPGFGIETLLLSAASRFPRGEKTALGRSLDPFGPVHTRYWQHNTGAAPLGGQPLSLLLDGDLTDAESTLETVVANHRTDQAVEGMVQLKAADGWSLGPAQFYYHLDPGQFMSQEILVMNATGDPATGGVTAWTEFEGQVYRDVLDRTPEPLTMTISRTESQLKITIENRGGIPAEGFLDVVVPTAFWSELTEYTPDGQITVFPRRAAISVAPFKTQDILFRFSDPAASPWAIAKLAANGHILYQHIPKVGGE